MTLQIKPHSASLNETLIKNALESGLSERKAVGVTVWKLWLFFRRNSVWIIGILLAFVGVAGMRKCPNELGSKLSEALLIAGILSISVDVWLKRKLQEDAAKDIFHHLLGMALPESLRMQLQDWLSKTTMYRENADIRAHLEDHGDRVTLSITMDVENVAARDCTYRQSLAFEEAIHARPIAASLRSPSVKEPKYVLHSGQIKLEEALPQEPMVWKWKGIEFALPKGERMISHISFELDRNQSDFYVLFFGQPTINPTLRITASPSLFIAASVDEDTHVTGNEYFYKRVFLRGDHIQIRWKPKG